jgi:hypothetical protein
MRDREYRRVRNSHPRRRKAKLMPSLSTLIGLLSCMAAIAAPVGQFSAAPALHVDGAHLEDASGKIVVLYGSIIMTEEEEMVPRCFRWNRFAHRQVRSHQKCQIDR